MKVVVFGASGIIGQHMRLAVPQGITPVWMRRKADPLHRGLDLTDDAAREAFLLQEKPDVIVNLAGESNTDKVEREPEKYWPINVQLPAALAKWCDANGSRLRSRRAGLKIGIFDGCRIDHKTLKSSFRTKAHADFRPNLRLFIEKWGVDNRGQSKEDSPYRELFPGVDETEVLELPEGVKQ